MGYEKNFINQYKRYTIRKMDKGFILFDKVEKKYVGEHHISWARCEYWFRQNINTLPQDLPEGTWYERKKLKENPNWIKFVPQTQEERRSRKKERNKRWRDNNIERIRKSSRERQARRWKETKHLRSDKAEQRKKFFTRKKLLNLLQKKINLELRKLRPKKQYVKARPKLKICPTCGIEFYGRPNAKWCKPTHAKRALLAKALRKRLGKGSDKRIPPWQDKEELWTFYEACPEGMQVDHIIPLNNELVCGLHTVNNLQYLSAEDNSRKSNYFDGTQDNQSWILKKKS